MHSQTRRWRRYFLSKTRPTDMRCFKKSQLIISACLTMIIGIFTIAYTIQQSILAEDNRQKEMAAAKLLHEQSIYQEYTNDILEKVFLISKNDQNSEEYKQHIRIKTLNTLPQMNLNQRKHLLFFLYDNKLIRTDYPKYIVDLTSADFSDLEFVNEKICYLSNASLKNIIANSIRFQGCYLEAADFSGTSLIGAKFINTRLGAATVDNANLTDVIFRQSNTGGLKFRNAILIRLFSDKPPQNTRFYNTDLYQSKWSIENIVNNTFDQQKKTVWNTRYPDGTFSQVDNKQLIADGGAEEGCGKDVDNVLHFEPRHQWYQSFRYGRVYLINGSALIPPLSFDQCYFPCYLNFTSIEQAIYVKNYSLVIDYDQVYYNLSANVSCPSNIGNPYIDIGFYTDQLITAGRLPDIYQIFNEADKDKKTFQFKSYQKSIPRTTRYIYVSILAPIDETYRTNYCLFDNIQLNIYKK